MQVRVELLGCIKVSYKADTEPIEILLTFNSVGVVCGHVAATPKLNSIV